MADVRREVKDYNDAVSNGSFVCERGACPGCFVSSDFARHDCARRQFRIRVFDPRVDEFVVEVVRSWRVRFCCRLCQKVFTDYPPFALPHKRFVKQDVLAKALKYLAGQAATYRESVRDKRVPPSYANNNKGRQLSHVTVWRWLSWLASLKNLVQRATQLVLQEDPQADLHRKSCPVANGKTRSPQRRQTLEQATMTLHAVEAFSLYFGVNLFTHLGTSGALA